MAKVQNRQKDKKSLKRPKGQSEAVNWRRTDNATAKRKKTKDTKYYTEDKRLSNTNTTKTGGVVRCFGRVSSACPTSGTRCVVLVTNTVICHEWGKNRIVITTNVWSFVTVMVAIVKLSKWWLQLDH
jgi:hypothetical protein